MKLKIESDVFDIIKRIKEIDDGYFILFDTNKNRYELHNKNQASTYCLMCPYENLDSRLLDFLCATNSRFIDNIIEEIDNNNNKIEISEEENAKSISDYMFREIYSFSNNSSKKFNDAKAFTNKWR